MKKSILVIVLVLGLATLALAQKSGAGYKGNFEKCAPDVKLVDMYEAKAKVQAIIDASYPGYLIHDVEAREMKKGAGFKIEAEKSMSRDLEFYVSPCGMVNGPYKD